MELGARPCSRLDMSLRMKPSATRTWRLDRGRGGRAREIYVIEWHFEAAFPRCRYGRVFKNECRLADVKIGIFEKSLILLILQFSFRQHALPRGTRSVWHIPERPTTHRGKSNRSGCRRAVRTRVVARIEGMGE